MKNTDPKSQLDKFKAMAKEVEADGDESALDQFIKKVLKAPAKKSSP